VGKKHNSKRLLSLTKVFLIHLSRTQETRSLNSPIYKMLDAVENIISDRSLRKTTTTIKTMTIRLWELSDEIQDLENAIALYLDNETLSDEQREIKLEETFNQWLSRGESFKVKAEQVARYIRHTEALSEARKAEARRIRELANQAENQATRLRRYLTNQMLRSDVQKIDGVSTKMAIR
jgi:glutamate mutase epsilon subunit